MILDNIPAPRGHNPRCAVACAYCSVQPSNGCSVRTCQSPDTATVDGINGRRCAAHPPTFDGTECLRLMRAAGHREALRYLRSMAAWEAA